MALGRRQLAVAYEHNHERRPNTEEVRDPNAPDGRRGTFVFASFGARRLYLGHQPPELMLDDRKTPDWVMPFDFPAKSRAVPIRAKAELRRFANRCLMAP